MSTKPRHSADARPTTPFTAAVTPRFLASVGFTDHAIERFARRAGLACAGRPIVEPIIRDLLSQEGALTHERPHWARSQNTAELYLQLGDWMLFILRPDIRRPGWHTAVTVVNGPEGNDWPTALRRGYINTPPAPRLRPLPSRRLSLRESLRDVRMRRRRGDRSGGFLAQLLDTHRDRFRSARAARQTVQAANRELLASYRDARARAREVHSQRWAGNRSASTRGRLR